EICKKLEELPPDQDRGSSENTDSGRMREEGSRLPAEWEFDPYLYNVNKGDIKIQSFRAKPANSWSSVLKSGGSME
ncbi:MAG: hypothetical protein M0T83_10745, partial [Nitrospiraceae bacterium]|nr:hypothetical protein [Nitrospiraceae bacterium]